MADKNLEGHLKRFRTYSDYDSASNEVPFRPFYPFSVPNVNQEQKRVELERQIEAQRVKGKIPVNRASRSSLRSRRLYRLNESKDADSEIKVISQSHRVYLINLAGW